MAERIDIGFRTPPAASGLTVEYRYPAGGGAWVDASLGPGEQYWNGPALADAQNLLLPVPLFCALIGGQFWFLSSADPFDIRINNRTYAEYLGMTSGPYLGVTQVSGTSPAIFISQYPWNWSPTWVRTRKMDISQRGQARVTPLAQWREWNVTAVLSSAELSAFRVLLQLLMRGLPGTWYRDASDLVTPWSWSDPRGYSRIVLSGSQRSYAEGWLTQPHQTHCQIPLTFKELPP